LIHHLDATDQAGLNPPASQEQILQSRHEHHSGSFLREEEEEDSDNENDGQDRTGFLRGVGPLMALGAPPMPSSHPTVAASLPQSPGPSTTSPPSMPAPPLATDRSPLVKEPAQTPSEQLAISHSGGRSGGDQVPTNMASHSGIGATAMDDSMDVPNQVGKDTCVTGLCEAIGIGGNGRLEDQTTETSVSGVPGISGNETAREQGDDMDTNDNGPVDAMAGAKASENERDVVSQQMDVDQSHSGDEGCDVEKGKGTSLRRSDRKRKTPPPPEREGTNRGRPKPASRKRVQSKEPRLKPRAKPKPVKKPTIQPNSGSLERNYFEEIEIGGTSRLVDMIDLTQDMVGRLSTHKDALY
jgi:hypothetical protein